MRLLPVFLLVALPVAAHAQGIQIEAQAKPDVDWANVETVASTAAPGPALWRVTRGDSEVWILGTVGAMPKTLGWNRQYLSDLLDGVRSIILPPGASEGMLEAGWFLITHGGKLSLPRGEKLEAGMPETLRGRFAATRARLGRGAARYETDTPIRAALRLQQDFMTTAALSGAEPGATMERLARTKRVPAHPVAETEVLPMIGDVLNLGLEQQRKCLAETVEDVDRLSAHAVAAAEAWAVGDIRGVKAHFSESRLNNCMTAAVGSYARFDEQHVAAFTAAIDAALQRPGKTIVMMGMGTLLRKNGVLDRLQARSITIEGPRE